MSPRPDYDDINRLERELFPEWFEDEGAEQAAPDAGRSRPPEDFRIAPGAVLQIDPNDAVHFYAASSMAPYNFTPEPKPKPLIYGPDGKPL